MLSAMAGSTIASRRRHDVERRERQRDAVGDREGGDDEQQAPGRSAEQQQPDQKQQMLGAYQDMVKSGRQEFRKTAIRPCRVPPKYSNWPRPRLRIACDAIAPFS
jgi:hypothetical protein